MPFFPYKGSIIGSDVDPSTNLERICPTGFGQALGHVTLLDKRIFPDLVLSCTPQYKACWVSPE